MAMSARQHRIGTRSRNGGSRDDLVTAPSGRRAADEDEQLLLHQTVMASKKQQIEQQQERLAKQRAFIRHEKRKLLLQNALLESERERFEASLASDWFCSEAFPSARDRRLAVDVGGQLFEVSSALAARDGGSLLAALADDDSPLLAAECGCFRVDREWWLFRYVLAFLRDGVLPQDPKLLRELYLESEFWKLESLRRAIEMRNMELLQRKQTSDAALAATAATSLAGSQAGAKLSGTAMKASSFLGRLKGEAAATATGPAPARDPSAWWLEPPVWWGQCSVAEKKADDAPAEPPAKVSAFASLLKKKAKLDAEPAAVSEQDAWWKSATYKGVDFARGLSPEQQKPPTAAAADGRHEDSATPRVPLVVNSTWASAHYLTQ
ncbi:hypothetical protein PybrP1_004591 [[Pythium] brassicae (nom. inval.)]|nr:hypothetical protein PybrP1_004591 [[Pythium] brassicae (nom. inval.)]